MFGAQKSIYLSVAIVSRGCTFVLAETEAQQVKRSRILKVIGTHGNLHKVSPNGDVPLEFTPYTNTISSEATSTHTHTQTHTHTHTHTQTQSHLRRLLHTHAHTQIHTRTHTNTHTQIHTRTHTNTRTHTHAHTHTSLEVYDDRDTQIITTTTCPVGYCSFAACASELHEVSPTDEGQEPSGTQSLCARPISRVTEFSIWDRFRGRMEASVPTTHSEVAVTNQIPAASAVAMFGQTGADPEGGWIATRYTVVAGPGHIECGKCCTRELCFGLGCTHQNLTLSLRNPFLAVSGAWWPRHPDVCW